ncbi:MAG: VWA domain-containing protein [candidate division Zixibacteria bacterium]|nr:VWA domain-containing protein [candidate division Zixibacteria bacterium]
MHKMLLILSVVALAILMIAVGCDDKDQSYLTKYYDSPNQQDEGPPDIECNNIVPSASFSTEPGNSSHVRINVSGLYNPVTEQPIVPQAGVNFFVEEDGVIKAIQIKRVDTSNTLMADVVFTVDYSESMSGEADAVAAGIIDFAQQLEATGLDVQFGCVGYYGNIRGAINLGTAAQLESYLNERNGVPRSGTSRVRDFAGLDSTALHDEAATFASDHNTSAENGIVGVFFADSMFNWRSGASRQFINFTDESTQPSGIAHWGTEYMCQQLAGHVNIHTVFSGFSLSDPFVPADTIASWTDLYDERPWWMSECTGGTIEFIDPGDATFDLSNLPVVAAMSNSYLVTFTTSDPDGTHTIRIYVYDEGADGVIEFIDIQYGP